MTCPPPNVACLLGWGFITFNYKKQNFDKYFLYFFTYIDVFSVSLGQHTVQWPKLTAKSVHVAWQNSSTWLNLLTNSYIERFIHTWNTCGAMFSKYYGGLRTFIVISGQLCYIWFSSSFCISPCYSLLSDFSSTYSFPFKIFIVCVFQPKVPRYLKRLGESCTTMQYISMPA